MLHKTTSRDGTRLAFEQLGDGPPIILVLGACNDRHTGAPLAQVLAQHFRVLRYDRRGRGDSSDNAPYAVEREVEDLAALLEVAGGSASVFGYSSGAMLALEAAASGLAIHSLALYELPPEQAPEHATELAALVAAGRRGDAVEYFQSQVVGIPPNVVASFRHAPFRAGLEAIAHTLVYDTTIMRKGRLRPELLAKVHPPTLAIAGSSSPAIMREIAEGLALRLPRGCVRILQGANHDLDPALLGPMLERHFEAA